MDVDVDRVRDCGDVQDGYRVVDLVQTALMEEGVVLLRAVGVFIMPISRDRGEDGVRKAAIVLDLEVDDRMLLCQEFGQLAVCSAGEGVEVCHLETEVHDLIEYQTLALPDVVGGADEHELPNAVHVLLDFVRVEEPLGPRVEVGRVRVRDFINGLAVLQLHRHPLGDAEALHESIVHPRY